MSNALRIIVTQEHIDKGRACPIRHGCPLKMAFAAAGFPDASVGITSVWLDGISGDRFVALTAHAEKFVRAFDHGLPVQPFSFDVDVKEVVRA